jgi:hypothetical protein
MTQISHFNFRQQSGVPTQARHQVNLGPLFHHLTDQQGFIKATPNPNQTVVGQQHCTPFTQGHNCGVS